MTTTSGKKEFSVAPMMGYTDRHFRYLLRLMSKKTQLYTEMLVSQSLIHGDRNRLLAFNQAEHPLVLQLGGSDPIELAFCAKLAEELGYDEINMNVGCPSNRVQSGNIGACLMADPSLVGRCVSEMRSVVSIPVTVKCRIGIDDQDSYDHLTHFIQIVKDFGCEKFIIHARKAWLKGLSPKENREKPTIRYDWVYQLKKDFPDLFIVINGEISKLSEVFQHLQKVDGVMLGRAICENPYFLSTIDKSVFHSQENVQPRFEIVQAYCHYMETEMSKGIPFTQLSRHIIAIFHGIPGAKAWRRCISENAHKPNMGPELIFNAAKLIQLA